VNARPLLALARRAGLSRASAWLEAHEGLVATQTRPDRPIPDGARANTSTLLPLAEYDLIIVAFSGGKDSTAAHLAVEDRLAFEGASTPVELWHHHIDGAPGSRHFMDWPVTPAYCDAYAEAVGRPIKAQWRDGGFYREINKWDQPLAAVAFEQPDGSITRIGGKGAPKRRKKFPQVSADLRVRWCSSTLKIDVGASAIRHDHRFKRGGKVLLVTGERRDESPNRRKYASVERHRASNLRRRVDQWRPVLDWTVEDVWSRMEIAGIQGHPAYEWYGRVSCAWCIFGGKREWATARELAPASFDEIAGLEVEFGRVHGLGRPLTIHRDRSVVQLADAGRSLVPAAELDRARRLLLSTDYPHPVIVPRSEWRLPSAAHKHTAGPS